MGLVGAAFLYTLGLALTLLGRLYDVSIPGRIVLNDALVLIGKRELDPRSLNN
jgi:hypothetical protein